MSLQHLCREGVVTDQIPMLSGVKQGDPLSPLLFNIALDPLRSWVRIEVRPTENDSIWLYKKMAISQLLLRVAS